MILSTQSIATMDDSTSDYEISSESAQYSGDETDSMSCDSGITMYDNMEDVERYDLLPDLTKSTEPVEGLGDEIGNGVLSVPVGRVDYERNELLEQMQRAWDVMELETGKGRRERTSLHASHLLHWSRLANRYIKICQNGQADIIRHFRPQMNEVTYADGEPKPFRVQRREKRKKLLMLVSVALRVSVQALLRTGCDWNYMRYCRVKPPNVIKV